jgi:transposase-like protein
MRSRNLGLVKVNDMQIPTSLIEAIKLYSDPQQCIDAVANLRWEDGKPVCIHCDTAEGERKHMWLKKQQRWKCYKCRKQFSVKKGTIFEDSPIGLDKWMCALWLLVNCKNGVSSYEIARDLSITQKSAWFVLQRLRFILKDTTLVPMGAGPVEVDESFHGGKPKNMHEDRRLKLKVGMNGYAEKTAVFGMLDRETRQVRAQVIPNVKRVTLQAAILNNIGTGATIYSDSWPGYDGLKKSGFVHDTVNHMNEYVRGQVHTQGIENFWSLLKRGLQGTYVAVEPYHMDRYIDEQCFRFNNRIGHNDSTRFIKALSQVVNRRLTYKELTGKGAGSAT